ncbi:Glycosyltransferase involved in cell wall bisynthesis [Arthrobacter subterraneus]|uniref:Glycosyltransferase involved in cell wall bisynthesis n=2 Tax=Arthrobacter subterraneus TaxID=335973 RepID=A0A1G8BMQ3_9MICC|nr:Glycosyltransferase involved in cell wall bisynthesis [Arthrobacter subterraneus]
MQDGVRTEARLNAMKPRLLILCFSPLRRDPRVLRQIALLGDSYDVSTCGFGLAPDGVSEHFEIPDSSTGWWPADVRFAGALLVGRQFERFYRNEPRVRKALSLIQRGAFDVIIANDLNTVPLAALLAPTKGFHADLHEWEPRIPGSGFKWRAMGLPYAHWQLRQVRRAHSVTTVNEGLAESYATEYGITADVVTNAAEFADCNPVDTHSPLRLVHSGGSNPGRRIDIMIDAMRGVEGATLDLMLMSTGAGTIESLKAYAKDIPNVRFREPVPFADMIPTLQQYDVGISMLPPTSFNNTMALPNKLFEYVQARLAVVVGPSPEMARIVQKHALGVVSGDFTPDSLREAIRSLTTANVDRFKANSHAAARELSSEKAVRPWSEAIDAIAGGGRVLTDKQD